MDICVPLLLYFMAVFHGCISWLYFVAVMVTLNKKTFIDFRKSNLQFTNGLLVRMNLSGSHTTEKCQPHTVPPSDLVELSIDV